MWQDEIVEAIRKYREEYAAEFGHELRKIFQDLKEKERKNPNRKGTLKPKIYLA